MKSLKINLRLLEPLLATQPNAGEPNSAVSYSFIPGSMIRGAFIRAYLQQNPNVDISASARDLFFDGTVCFLNAYRTSPDYERMLPTPLSWHVDKDEVEDENATIHDFLIKPADSLQKPKKPKGEFCLRTNNHALLESPKRHITVHNASDQRGRKQAGTSQVFRYDALAEDQSFTGEVISEDANLLKILQACIGDTIFLGGSHTGGYGPVQITCELNEERDWQEYQPFASSSVTTITLLSDLLLPDGEISTLDSLAKCAGITTGDILNAYCETRLVGGFNRTWGLPLPQSWAIQAGSTFLINANAKLNANAFAAGIGGRVAEGFGRVAVNLHTTDTVTRIPSGKSGKAGVGDTPPTLILYSHQKATNMATCLLKSRLETKLMELLAREMWFSDPPSSTQLNRVRVVARQSMLSKDANAVKNHFAELKSAQKTWERARINGASLSAWVIDHSSMDQAKFRALFDPENSIPKIAGRAAEFTQEIVNEYCARYVDGVMKLAVEEQRAQEGR